MIYNPFPQVNLPFGKDNKYFYWLFEAMLKVEKSFITYSIKDSTYQEETSETIKEHVERVFTYELYRQWMNVLEANEVRNLVVNAEVGKELIERTRNTSQNNNVFPDFVLHESQENDKQQLIVGEVKRDVSLEPKDIFHDLHKIGFFMKEGLFWKKPFNYGVFIIVGESVSLKKMAIPDDTNSELLGQEISYGKFKKDFKEKLSHIACITYNGTILEYDTLENVIREIKKRRKKKENE